MPGKRGAGHRHSVVEIAGALLCAGAIHCPAPALAFALRRRSPHPAPALFLRYACVLPRAAPAPSPALCSRSPQQYIGALLALRRRSLLRRAGALHWATRALYAGAGAIPFASQLSPILRRSSLHDADTWARQGRLILLAAGLLVGEPRGGATVPAAAIEPLFDIEIGRASCRERVCMLV